MDNETLAKLCALAAFILPPLALLVIIIKPELYIKLSIQLTKQSLKFLGMELNGEIKYTPKTFKVFRIYFTFILLIILVVWFIVGRQMLADLIRVKYR